MYHPIQIGDVFATHSHPPSAPFKSWAVSHFDEDLQLVGSAGYHLAGLPADQNSVTPIIDREDANPFGITKYLGPMNMDFDGAMVM